MQAGQLREVLEEVRRLFATGGAAAVERDLGRLAELLEGHETKELEAYLAELARHVDAVVAKPADKTALDYASRFEQAGLDEARFKSLVRSMRDDPKVSKEVALAVAKSVGVIRLNTKSRASAIESIEKHLYWLLYNRDADSMAKRATPW